jgi:hypothetical protein
MKLIALVPVKLIALVPVKLIALVPVKLIALVPVKLIALVPCRERSMAVSASRHCRHTVLDKAWRTWLVAAALKRR